MEASIRNLAFLKEVIFVNFKIQKEIIATRA